MLARQRPRSKPKAEEPFWLSQTLPGVPGAEPYHGRGASHKSEREVGGLVPHAW